MKLTEQRWLNNTIDFFENQLKKLPNIIYSGHIVSIKGLVLSVSGISLPIGTTCFVKSRQLNSFLRKKCEVIGFKNSQIFIIPLDGQIDGISSGDRVVPCMQNYFQSQVIEKKVPLGESLLGRVVDSSGNSLDGLGLLIPDCYDLLSNSTINPMHRKPVDQILDLGIRSINALFTIGLGQRIGLFSSSGVGKSILLGMITRNTTADVTVIGLIGERGREVKEFINNVLGTQGMSKAVIVVEPADVSPLLRVQGALYATRIAEYFREKKKNVLLIIDSLTRYAMSLREISLSMNEFPVAKGYPVSVFSKLSILLERAGNSSLGSMSAIYTILTESDKDNDPIADVARSVLDGHLILSKSIAKRGIYPAINVETSISRVMTSLVSSKHYSRMLYFKKLISAYQKNQELINIGAYVIGTDPVIDKSIEMKRKLDAFLEQKIFECIDYHSSYTELKRLFSKTNNIID